MDFVDRTKEHDPSGLELTGGLIIAHGKGDGIQCLEGDARFQILSRIGQGFQWVIGGHHCCVRVALAHPAFGIDHLDGKEAGTMEVEVGGRGYSG